MDDWQMKEERREWLGNRDKQQKQQQQLEAIKETDDLGEEEEDEEEENGWENLDVWTQVNKNEQQSNGGWSKPELHNK